MDEEAKRRAAGLRIKEARKAARLTQNALAKQLALPQSVISDWENGQLQSWRDHLESLCRALNQPPSYFAAYGATQGSVNGNAVRQFPVVGEVHGGNFRMAFEYPQPWETREVAARHLQGYRDLRWLRVVGDSVNLLYPNGSYVLVAPTSETDVRHGDKVVVFSHLGGLVEATIKELRVENGRIVLYPRSTHPDHQTPIYLDAEEQDSPEVAYVVVSSQRDEERPPAPVTIPLRR
jgi:SOS-response transcriptional repressor LexA